MIVDCHVHIAASMPGNGRISARLLRSIPYRYIRWKYGLRGELQTLEELYAQLLARTIDECELLDAAAVFAFDAVYDREGNADWDHTHLYVTNEYARRLCDRHPKMLFVGSVNPYRKDAIAELERCVAAGAVMIKWLPITQNFDPADARCLPFYEALAHYRVPLLSHTGSEHALPNLNKSVADPALLKPALSRGVTVIAAHCGSRVMPWEPDFVPTWVKMAKDHEKLYGDTSALNVPTRWYAFKAILEDKMAASKLVHGSDWPIPPIPPPHRVGWKAAFGLLKGSNWMRRDILIKRKLDFDDAYWHRAATLMRLGKSA